MLHITLYIKFPKIVYVDLGICRKVVMRCSEPCRFLRSGGRFTIISTISEIQVNCRLHSRNDYDIRVWDNIHIDIDGRPDQRLGYFSRKLARSVWEIDWNWCVTPESFLFAMTVKCMAMMISSYSMLFLEITFSLWYLQTHLVRIPLSKSSGWINVSTQEKPVDAPFTFRTDVVNSARLVDRLAAACT
jgi:hypothetical protein